MNKKKYFDKIINSETSWSCNRIDGYPRSTQVCFRYPDHSIQPKYVERASTLSHLIQHLSRAALQQLPGPKRRHWRQPQVNLPWSIGDLLSGRDGLLFSSYRVTSQLVLNDHVGDEASRGESQLVLCSTVASWRKPGRRHPPRLSPRCLSTYCRAGRYIYWLKWDDCDSTQDSYPNQKTTMKLLVPTLSKENLNFGCNKNRITGLKKNQSKYSLNFSYIVLKIRS